VTNLNYIHEEIKGISRSASYRSVLSHFHFLSKHLKIRIYKTINLSIVSYGHETYSLTLREEHRLRVFENRVLGRMFGPKRKEVAGGWRRLHNVELHNLHASPHVITVIRLRRVRRVGHEARMGVLRYTYINLVGKHEGKRILVRSRHRWEDIIIMDIRKTG
jgi:hypothetical protein